MTAPRRWPSRRRPRPAHPAAPAPARQPPPGRGADRRAATAAAADGSVAGTWTVATGTEAGYRVRERLANLDAESDAVGRTKDVTGSISYE